MSKYTVLYRDEGVFPDRDAWWFKVAVIKDRDSLGIALGVINGPSWDRELPGGGDGPRIMSNAAVRLLALVVQDAVEAGQFRDEWELDAAEFTLDAHDARHLVNVGVAEPHRHEAGGAVAFFEH